MLTLVSLAGAAVLFPLTGRPGGPRGRCAAARLAEGEFIVQRHEWESLPNPRFAYNAAEDDWVLEGAAAVRDFTASLEPEFAALRSRPFFRYYQVDLLASCTYLPQSEAPCELDACEIEPSDHAPDRIQERDLNEYEFELDSWSRWDMPSDFTEYYDLHALKETNTGYDGSRVWRFINQKICFQLDLEEAKNSWKRDFNRGVSGLHSAVSASIIRDIMDEGDTEGALAQFRRRLQDEPGAINNLYFATLLSLCAVQRLQPRLERCTFIGDADACKPHIEAILSSPMMSHPALARAAALLRENADSENAAPWKMRLRTRDLMGVMNCVQCNLCRLHGKVMVHGFATSLQVLLGHRGRGEDCDRDTDPFGLSRVEVASLVTTTAKLLSACEVVQELSDLEAAQPDAETTTTAKS